jgi:hypothetical protein
VPGPVENSYIQNAFLILPFGFPKTCGHGVHRGAGGQDRGGAGAAAAGVRATSIEANVSFIHCFASIIIPQVHPMQGKSPILSSSVC